MERKYIFFALALLAVYFIGFGINIMDIDAGQYASMSREMLESGHFLQVYDMGKDYLDKPPFLFWISAMSMKIFGINNFAYRLPSFLFGMLAVVSTYQLAKLFYSKKTSFIAAFILASSQGFILMNHDVRTDTILMGCVAFCIWQLAAWFQFHKPLNFVAGCIAIGLGMMTKGPIALMVPCFAFGTHFILQRNWTAFLKWEYLVGVAIIMICVFPMCWGLYQQFDLHPEKLIDGKHQVSGLRFFFWTQSFGRITGESSWNNGANIFFLLQNMAWSFLPWILFFLIGFFKEMATLVKQKFKISTQQEAITIGGFLLSYLSLGMSKYQLPHYIFVAFPFAAIITAKYLTELFEGQQEKARKLWLNVHFFIFVLLWLVLIVLLTIPFQTISKVYPILASFTLIGLVFFYFKIKKNQSAILLICLYSSIGLNLFLNGLFYPALLQYQAGSTAGTWIHQHQIPTKKTFTYQYFVWRSLHFYAQGLIHAKDDISTIQSGDYILTEATKLKDFENKPLRYEVLHQGVDFPVSKISLPFLDPKRRESSLRKYVLIKIK